jgi:NTP pyrophosphatase (non-canonical NTP hydrolase)
MKTTDKIDPDGGFALDLSSILYELGRNVGEVNVANGWDTSRAMVAAPAQYDPRWHVAHKIAELGLIDTETSEAIEEVRKGHEHTYRYYREDGKPEGVPSELADVIIRVLDISDAYGIDIGAAVVEKLNHNATRGLHHGGKAL